MLARSRRGSQTFMFYNHQRRCVRLSPCLRGTLRHGQRKRLAGFIQFRVQGLGLEPTGTRHSAARPAEGHETDRGSDVDSFSVSDVWSRLSL